MKSTIMLRFCVLFAAGILFSGCSGDSVEDRLSPDQRLALKDLLRERPRASLVEISDCTSPLLDSLRSVHPSYLPYYAEADFNGDGSADFVIATFSAGAYDLWLFAGSGLGYHTPQNFGTTASLAEGGFLVEGNRLYVGTLDGRNGRTYVWNPDVRRMVVTGAGLASPAE